MLLLGLMEVVVVAAVVVVVAGVRVMNLDIPRCTELYKFAWTNRVQQSSDIVDRKRLLQESTLLFYLYLHRTGERVPLSSY